MLKQTNKQSLCPAFPIANQKNKKKQAWRVAAWLYAYSITATKSSWIAHVEHVHETKQFNAAIKIDGVLFSAVSKADLFSTSLSHFTIKKYIYKFVYVDLPRSNTQYALHFIFLQIN